jgi:hypothetical protein
MLKLPIGALVAIVGILFIQGEFIPGLSVLDTPQQIIAYAVVLGASQHIVTRLIDRQSQTLLDRTPSNDLSRPPVVDEARATDPARPGSAR